MPMKWNAVIMAGGAGTRFWPASRRRKPKQLLPIAGEKTMIRETVDRLLPMIGPERIWPALGPHLLDATARELPEVPMDNYLIEPVGRNTAPCIGFAALILRRCAPETPLGILPSDHFIADVPAFREVLEQALALAAEGRIVTLGIKPTRPETGYGYLRTSITDLTTNEARPVLQVECFTEKPDLETAERYIRAPGYLWNSGMFFFTPETILTAMERNMPRLRSALERIDRIIGQENYEAGLRDIFEGLESVSIDYGVMEKERELLALLLDCGWNDLGSWPALAEILPADDDGNVVQGSALLVDSRGCQVQAPHRTIALLGVEDLLVVDTADALLVCPKSRAQDIRAIVKALEEAGRDDLL